jgi:hypothetical protein
VAPGSDGATPYREGAVAWVRCRRIATLKPGDVERESGMSVGERVGIVTGAVGDMVEQARRNVPDFLRGAGWLLGLAALAYIVGSVAAIARR